MQLADIIDREGPAGQAKQKIIDALAEFPKPTSPLLVNQEPSPDHYADETRSRALNAIAFLSNPDKLPDHIQPLLKTWPSDNPVLSTPEDQWNNYKHKERKSFEEGGYFTLDAITMRDEEIGTDVKNQASRPVHTAEFDKLIDNLGFKSRLEAYRNGTLEKTQLPFAQRNIRQNGMVSEHRIFIAGEDQMKPIIDGQNRRWALALVDGNTVPDTSKPDGDKTLKEYMYLRMVCLDSQGPF